MVSIIIPVYNAEKYIQRCVNSIFEHISEGLFEIIIVNDGSTDNSADICDEIKEKFKNIIVIHQNNRGVSASRKRGIEFATGDWIVFVDADDMVIGNFILYIERYKENCDWIVFSGKLVNAETVKVHKQEFYAGILGISNTSFLKVSRLNAVWSKAYKKQLIIENDISFDEDVFHGEDMLFNLLYCSHCDTVSFVDKSVYQLVSNPWSATKKYQPDNLANDMLFYKKINDYGLIDNWENRLSESIANGIWLVFRHNLAHTLNKTSLIEKIRIIKRIVKSEPYRGVLKEYHSTKKNRVLFFYLLRHKLYFEALLYVKLVNFKMAKKQEKVVFDNI